MRSTKVVLIAAVVAVVALGAFSQQALAQGVNVTMLVNTSTCLDTLQSTHVVKILGESGLATTPAMTWTIADGITMTNIGGDYWSATFQATPGDTIRFKFWTGFGPTTGTFHWDGWEGPLNAGFAANNNRALVVGANDTTLPLQYFNGWESTLVQYWRPFQSKTDTIAVYFRVNMGTASFDPASQVVDVRGGAPLGADPTWINIKTLSRETNSVNGGSLWSGVAYVPKSAVTPGVTAQDFKYVIQSNTWETSSDRTFTFGSLNDTTIHWVYFNNQPPSGPRVTADVLWLLKLNALEQVGLFNRALGDKVAITGAKGWPPTGFDFDTEPTMLKMGYDPYDKSWNLVETFTLFPNEQLAYKYFIAWDTTRVDTAHVNYIPGLRLDDGWEEPGVTGGADRRYTYTGDLAQMIPGDFGSDYQFFNSLHWKGAIRHPIQVTFNINMAPAAMSASNPNVLFRPGIDTAYIQFDGSFVPITQGSSMWGTDNRLPLTDSDGDGIYTAVFDLLQPSLYQHCFRVVYTSTSGEIWNGSGSAIRGRRYYQYVHPTDVYPDSAVWPATYTMSTLDWMLDDLTIEDPPNLDQVTVGVSDNGSDVPVVFDLRQNYPNPFNPSTIITYEVPVREHVRLDVYSILGQRVATLVDQTMDAGTHSIAWNARLQNASSGVYLVRMRAGSYSAVRTMVLAR